MDVRRIILAITHRKGLFAAFFLLSVCIFVLIPQASTMYESCAKVLLTPSNAPVAFGDQGRSFGDPNWLSDEATLRELVSSERVMKRVIQAAGLKMEWLDLRERVILEPLSGGLNNRVTLFALGCEDEDPKNAQKIAQALADEFVKSVEELSAREFSSTRRFLEELVAEAQEKVDVTSDKLLGITTSHADKAEGTVLAESQNDLETERRKMRDESAMLEAEVGAMQRFLAGQLDTPPWSVLGQDTGLRQMEGAVGEARLKLVELQQRYTDDNQQVIEQKAKLAKVQQLYQGRLTAYVQSLHAEKSRSLAEKRSRLSSVQARLSELRNRQLTPQQKRDVAKLERQLQTWEENHLTLVKQLYQARVVEQSSRRQGSIDVLENPYPGQISKKKKRHGLAMIYGLGIPFSLIAATLMVMGIEYFFANLRLVPRIESTLGIPMLAIIPPVSNALAKNWEDYKHTNTVPLPATPLVSTTSPPDGI